jgi:formylglycine-generating enzyme required for sulfatase activity
MPSPAPVDVFYEIRGGNQLAGMSGNVSEWAETTVGNGESGFWGRIESGNSWKITMSQLGHNVSSGVQVDSTLDQKDELGFRVAKAISL